MASIDNIAEWYRRVPRLLLVISLLVFFRLIEVSATTLDQYHQRVHQAVTALDSLSQMDEGETQEARDYRTRETLSAVRSALPQTEIVEASGVALSIDNNWLHMHLDQYEQADIYDRTTLLAVTTERLRAIEERLEEAQADASPPLISKTSAKTKLSEILSRPQYSTRVQDTALRRFLEQLVEWLRALIPRPKALPVGTSDIFTTVVQVIVVLMAFAVIAYAFRAIYVRTFSSRRRLRKDKRQKPRIVLGETLDPGQNSIDLIAEAEALARKGELRLAIRKAYIALLLELGERKVISLASHRTNRDYLDALANDRPLFDGVKKLTRSFEVHWYGSSKTTDEDWREFLNGYRQVVPG